MQVNILKLLQWKLRKKATKLKRLKKKLYKQYCTEMKKKKKNYGWEIYELTSFIKSPNKDCGGVNYQFKALLELCFNNMSLTL